MAWLPAWRVWGSGRAVGPGCLVLVCWLFLVLWRWRFRHLGVWLPVLVALLAVLLGEPLASMQPWFWLSFGAVMLLILIFSGRLGAWSWWSTLLRAQGAK